MKLRIILDIDVPGVTDPETLADLATSYFIHQYGSCDAGHTPFDLFEQAIIDGIGNGDLHYLMQSVGHSIVVDHSFIERRDEA